MLTYLCVGASNFGLYYGSAEKSGQLAYRVSFSTASGRADGDCVYVDEKMEKTFSIFHPEKDAVRGVRRAESEVQDRKYFSMAFTRTHNHNDLYSLCEHSFISSSLGRPGLAGVCSDFLG